jgi:hypothetical protein
MLQEHLQVSKNIRSFVKELLRTKHGIKFKVTTRRKRAAWQWIQQPLISLEPDPFFVTLQQNHNHVYACKSLSSRACTDTEHFVRNTVISSSIRGICTDMTISYLAAVTGSTNPAGRRATRPGGSAEGKTNYRR